MSRSPLQPLPSRTSFHSGFSIVELLVVVIIITILIALLYPVAGRMREGALRVGCTSNLRTIGTALTGYAIENRGRVPGPSLDIVEIAKGETIAGKLKDYIEPKVADSVWECPANRELIERNKLGKKNNTSRNSAYMAHYPFFGYSYAPPKESPQPMLLAEIKDKPRDQQWLLQDIDYWNYPMAERIGGTYPPIHSGGRNHLFPDITVEWVKTPPK